MPTVYRGPYEYSVPGHHRDYWPQDEPPAEGGRRTAEREEVHA
jgi:cytochrome c oxidase subunit 1